MNTDHLQQIINNYLSRFEYLNGKDHMEYYKWQVAYRFREMMDEALAAPRDEFHAKLKSVKKLTQNLIDNYTQPFGGLVEFSKKEPETVRSMFTALLGAAGATTEEKLSAIQAFWDASLQLSSKYSPGSFLYKVDLHSITGYLFLYDPDHNYMFKASHCRAFADCVEFYDDWGEGANTKLDVFFRMCDEVLLFLKQVDDLKLADEKRRNLSPAELHPDKEKHILLFDLIYCCSTYELFDGITFSKPKAGERRFILERKEKAQKLAADLEAAREKLSLLDEATAWLKSTLKPGVAIHHRSYGDGSIIKADENLIIAMFSKTGQKAMDTLTCLNNKIIRFEDEDIAAGLLKYSGLITKSRDIRRAVTQAEELLAPYIEYLD